jgi:hypothetical protein
MAEVAVYAVTASGVMGSGIAKAYRSIQGLPSLPVGRRQTALILGFWA